jgi:O-antigen/teichoic acid export membrane protein
MRLASFRKWIDDKASSDPVAKTVFSLAQDSLVYLIGAAMIGLGSFILVPLYTRRLAPAEFAVYALVDINVLILVTVTQLGLGVSYLKWFSETDASKRGTLLGSMLMTGALAALAGGSLLTIAIASPLGEHWLQSSDRRFAWTLLPIVILENLQGLLLTDLRARRRAGAFSSIAGVRLLAIVGAILWFIVLRGQGIDGILCLRSVKLRFSSSTALQMIRYGLPLVWCALIAMVLDASGRYFLTHYSTLEQVGFYGIAIKVANVFHMLITRPFGVAWGGLMFQIVKWQNARLVYSKILSYVWVISLSGAFILALFTPTLFAIFATPAYLPATAVFPLLLLVRAVSTMEYPTAIGIYLSERTKWFTPIYLVGLGVNLLANYVLIPRYGMFGASWSWLLAWIVIVCLMAWVGERYYSLDYDWKMLILPMVPWAGIFLGQYRFAQRMPRLHWPVQITLTLAVLLGVGLLLVNDFRQTQRKVSLEKASQ